MHKASMEMVYLAATLPGVAPVVVHTAQRAAAHRCSGKSVELGFEPADQGAPKPDPMRTNYGAGFQEVLGRRLEGV